MNANIRNNIKVTYLDGIKTLRIMFPLLDEDIIYAILEQTGKIILKKLRF